MRKGAYCPSQGGRWYLTLTDFNGTKQIFLEQNYRSTAAILNASLAIIAQGDCVYISNPKPSLTAASDESRIQKSLHTSHPTGTRPVLRFLPTEHAEATFIAGEIKRLVAQMGGVLRWGDFAVLRKHYPLMNSSLFHTDRPKSASMHCHGQ